jgi:hypothetical protein
MFFPGWIDLNIDQIDLLAIGYKPLMVGSASTPLSNSPPYKADGYYLASAARSAHYRLTATLRERLRSVTDRSILAVLDGH